MLTVEVEVEYKHLVEERHQYRSVKGSSTVHALVELIHLWQQSLDEPGKVLRVLLVDYSKAFDRVDHGILLRKLASMGIPDLLTRWVTSFLCGRCQCTILGDIVSEWTTINAGVPQAHSLDQSGLSSTSTISALMQQARSLKLFAASMWMTARCGRSVIARSLTPW